MTEAPNPKTLDLAAVLSGIEYPTTEVTVYFDEKLGYAIKSVREGVELADRLGKNDEADDLHAQLTELVEQVKDAAYTVTIQDVPTHVRKSVLAKTRAKFPDKKNVFGQPEENYEQDQEYTRLLWLAMVKKIVDPAGAVAEVDEQVIDNLIKFAPSTAQQTINAGIEDLSEGAKSGFEYAVQELDFLSTPSATDNPKD